MNVSQKTSYEKLFVLMWSQLEFLKKTAKGREMYRMIIVCWVGLGLFLFCGLCIA